MYDTEFKRYVYNANDPKSFDDIAGMSDLKTKITEEIVEPWANRIELEKQGIRMPDGTLLHGPTGSGKTFFAKAAAKKLDIPLYILKMSDVGTSFQHETSAKVAKIIKQLETKFIETGEPSALFLDEIDSIGGNKDGASGSTVEEVNTLLQQLDNPGDKGIVLFGATNELDKVAPALLRDGRIGNQIYVGYQDFEGRLDMIKKVLSKKPFAAEFMKNEDKLNQLARDFEDMPSPSISKVLNDALRESILKKTDIEDSIKTALDNYQQKELDAMLAKNSKSNCTTMKVDKKSTIKYDTKYQRVDLPDHVPENLDGLGGMYDVKYEVKKNLIDRYSAESISRFKENHMQIPAGVLLHGPSDCGKSTILYTAAKQMGIPVYEITKGKQGTALIAGIENNLDALFEQCALKFKKTGEMSLIVMNEIEDWFPDKNSFGHATHEGSVTNELLKWFEKAGQNGIIIAGTTNHLKKMEGAAIKNYSRLRPIEVGLPDAESRVGIIKHAVTNRVIAKDLDTSEAIKELSDIFDGHSVGKISGTINEAILESIETGKNLNLNIIRKMVTKLK